MVTAGRFAALYDEVALLRRHMAAVEAELAEPLGAVAAEQRESARNLAYYLALRRHDLRPLQMELASLGLSSLGRMEGWVSGCVDAVMSVLARLGGVAHTSDANLMGMAHGQALLRRHTEDLLGPAPAGRETRVMVTMPGEAATDGGKLIGDLLAGGMDVMRVNCAHDDAAAWRSMIGHLREAQRRQGRGCRVMCDLAGPKLRTGPMEPGPRVVSYHPLLAVDGAVLSPAVVRLVAEGSAGIPVGTLLQHMQAGDEIRFTDARGRRRSIAVARVAAGVVEGLAQRSAYVTTGCPLELRRNGEVVARAAVGDLPATETRIPLRVGEEIELVALPALGHAARDGSRAVVGCTLVEALQAIRVGQPVYFDDGKIAGRVIEVGPGRAVVRVDQTRSAHAKLAADKGINLPETNVPVGALSAKDLADLRAVSGITDAVGLSFVREAEDVRGLVAELERLGAGHVGIVLKIETRQAFEHLPRLLLTALASPPVGVMVARGDLGVEMGFERLAEVQEEILWLAEAAHVPVVWATQVLETLSRKGVPSRAEVTDAAMGGRSECVMLNKGPYVREAVEFLDDVLKRMAEHVDKKRSMLRKLAVSENV